MAQHSGLATKWYRSLMERLGLQAVTRSGYIFATAVVLQVSSTFFVLYFFDYKTEFFFLPKQSKKSRFVL